jgi:hypothetical protein
MLLPACIQLFKMQWNRQFRYYFSKKNYYFKKKKLYCLYNKCSFYRKLVKTTIKADRLRWLQYIDDNLKTQDSILEVLGFS